MIALRGVEPGRGLAFFSHAVEHALERVASSGSPITPVEAMKTSRGAAAGGLGGEIGRQLDGLAALLAGEGIGVAGIDHQRAAPLPPPRFSRHQSTGADGHFERVKTPATAVSGSSDT